MLASLSHFVLLALVLPTSSIRATLAAPTAIQHSADDSLDTRSGPHEARQMGGYQQFGGMPAGMPDNIRVDMGGGDMMNLPDFVEDTIDQFQNGQPPDNPMDTQPFINTTSVSSTSTTMALPGGGTASIEQTVNLVQGQAQVTALEQGNPYQSTGGYHGECGHPQSIITKTITMTRSHAATSTSVNTILITNTVTETSTITISDSQASIPSETHYTQAITQSSVSSSTSTRTSFSTSTRPSRSSTYSKQRPTQTISSSSVTSQTATSSHTYIAPPSSQPVVTSSSSTTLAPSPSNSSPPPSGGFQAAVLDSHNEWRAKYGAGPLAWDDSLATTALNWANGCKWEHGPGASNLDSAASSNGKPSLNGSTVVDHWINGPDEASAWNPQNPVASHFTQVVWKSAKKLGCATVQCDLSLYDPSWWPAAYAVCYYATGNDVTAFAANVGTLRS